MAGFTQKKFLAQPLERQHKKCAELLRLLYDKYSRRLEWTADWELYRQFLSWMQEPLQPMPSSIKALADLYHFHLQKARVSKREHHLLPGSAAETVRKGNRPGRLPSIWTASVLHTILEALLELSKPFLWGAFIFPRQCLMPPTNRSKIRPWDLINGFPARKESNWPHCRGPLSPLRQPKRLSLYMNLFFPHPLL